MATTTESTNVPPDQHGFAQEHAAVNRPPETAAGVNTPVADDYDPDETREWLESLEYVLETAGSERVSFLLQRLQEKAYREGVRLPFTATTPYINTIPLEREPEFPGDREMERRIKNIIRWNAMAMVVAAQKRSKGIGGHISTYASSATLYEVGFNHFFRGDDNQEGVGDLVLFQGHASPGMYARAFVEGRLTERNLLNFRRELGEGGGLSSYPHPWLMPDFWQYPTVSMGLGPIMSIFQARFNRYLRDRGLKNTDRCRVWSFVGDGECDEPETLGSITLAARERLDNLIWVVNCNLQRLDGPVRGNGKIIQELEGLFRGAGWNVIKVIWGSDVDEMLSHDDTGMLVKRLGEVVDGQYQKYARSNGAFIREDFWGKYPETAEIAKHFSDEQLARVRRGGHDPIKMYAAYKAATEYKGAPTVILAKTVKGYSLGSGLEAVMGTHNKKEMEEHELVAFRDRCGVPLSDEDAKAAKFYRPPAESPEMQYLHARRKELGGYLPSRRNKAEPLSLPADSVFSRYAQGSGETEASTTMVFVQILRDLMRDQSVGKHIVPIVPDESRTFGMDGLFGAVGIYSSQGQLYDPADRMSQHQMAYYKESKTGQIIEEGINEAGSMASFIAAGTAHTTVGINMIPMYIYYSMFGFQRVGDLIWAAADMRCRGFLIGGTSGRTTLNGEGLQHEDGHSHLAASTVPNLLDYDPAYAYEIALIIQDGIKRMYHDQEDIFYYLTVHNENYQMPAMPEGATEGILKGMYRFKAVDAGKKAPKVNLFGSGSILREVLRAQEILAGYGVSSQVWSVTSYKSLAKESEDCQRWNLLHPAETPRQSYFQQKLAEDPEACLTVASSDNVRNVSLQVTPFVSTPYYVLGCDGFGRSETRPNLRRFFEVDAEYVTLATLSELAKLGKVKNTVPAEAIGKLGLDPEKQNPVGVGVPGPHDTAE